MYKFLLILLACTCLLILLSFYHLSPVGNLWKTDPYLRRRTRVERACRDFKKQIAGDEAKRARTDHPPDPNVLVSRDERFFWCKVPKAASTSWKAYFLKHTGEGEAGMENWTGAQINSLFWQKFEHPASTLGLLARIDNVRHLQRMMSPPRCKILH